MNVFYLANIVKFSLFPIKNCNFSNKNMLKLL